MPRKMREYLCETGRSITAEGWPETGYAYRNDKCGLTFHEDILVYNIDSLKMVLGKRSHIVEHAVKQRWKKVALTPDGSREFREFDAIEEPEWHDAIRDTPGDMERVFAELEDNRGMKFHYIVHRVVHDLYDEDNIRISIAENWYDDFNQIITSKVIRWKRLCDV